MDETLRDKLRAVSVATLATALFKRGLRNQVIQGVHPVSRKGRNMVGPAFTLRYIPAREDRNQISEFRNQTIPSAWQLRPVRRATCSSWIAAKTRAPLLPETSWSRG